MELDNMNEIIRFLKEDMRKWEMFKLLFKSLTLIELLTGTLAI